MARSDSSVEVVIDPVRSKHLTHFEQELNASLDRHSKVESEVVRRSEQGVIIRDGVLNLPSRTDFRCLRGEAETQRDLRSPTVTEFEPVELSLSKTLSVTVFPFNWDELKISFDSGDDHKRLLRLRMWYLEWFLPRRDPSNSALKGVLHSIRGPKRNGNLWQVCIDMGSAPSSALTELLLALESRGVSELTLGTELDKVESIET